MPLTRTRLAKNILLEKVSRIQNRAVVVATAARFRDRAARERIAVSAALGRVGIRLLGIGGESLVVAAVLSVGAVQLAHTKRSTRIASMPTTRKQSPSPDPAARHLGNGSRHNCVSSLEICVGRLAQNDDSYGELTASEFEDWVYRVCGDVMEGDGVVCESLP